MTPRPPILFSGTANRPLAEALARELGVPLGACAVAAFPDGEISVVLEEPVQRRDVVLVQPTSPPVNDHLMELLAFTDACRRAGAGRITAVVPYFGYARQDRRAELREPITARMVATLLETVGIDHLVTVDLHTPQMQGFFRIPVDALSAVEVLCAELDAMLPPDAVVVSPDAGRVALATQYASALGRSLAVLHKDRVSGSETRVTQLVGEVDGRECLLIDDMISTGGTLVKSAAALRDAGATRLVACATHGLLLSNAMERLRGAGFDAVVVTDTVRVAGGEARPRVVSVAPLLGRAVRAAVEGE